MCCLYKNSILRSFLYNEVNEMSNKTYMVLYALLYKGCNFFSFLFIRAVLRFKCALKMPGRVEVAGLSLTSHTGGTDYKMRPGPGKKDYGFLPLSL